MHAIADCAIADSRVIKELLDCILHYLREAFTLSNLQEMKKVVDLINYEIEYVLRPRTAPMRYVPMNFCTCKSAS